MDVGLGSWCAVFLMLNFQGDQKLFFMDNICLIWLQIQWLFLQSGIVSKGDILFVVSSCACVYHAVFGCKYLVFTCPVFSFTQSTGWEVGG